MLILVARYGGGEIGEHHDHFLARLRQQPTSGQHLDRLLQEVLVLRQEDAGGFSAARDVLQDLKSDVLGVSSAVV